MTINGIDVSTWGARQSTVRFGQTNYTNSSYWKAGTAIPMIFSGITGFKSLTVTLIFKDGTRNDKLKGASDVVAACKDKVALILDGIDHRFTGYLVSAQNEELSTRWLHRLTLQFSGYEHGANFEVSGTSSLTINNPGNTASPARVALTPTANISSVTLTGLCRDPYTGEDQTVTVNSLTNGRLIVINGINGGITEAPGNPKDIDIWHLPTMLPGENTVTCSDSRVNIVVRTIPIYA